MQKMITIQIAGPEGNTSREVQASVVKGLALHNSPGSGWVLTPENCGLFIWRDYSRTKAARMRQAIKDVYDWTSIGPEPTRDERSVIRQILQDYLEEE